jgi:hypothetical protein
MSCCDFVVILQYSIAIEFENGSYTLHPESSQFGCTQRAYAAAAEYVDSATHRPQDFFVAYGRHRLKISVYKSDHLGTFEGRAVDVAFSSRREIYCF